MTTDNPSADRDTTKSSQTLPARTAPPSSFVYCAPRDQAPSAARQDGAESPDASLQRPSVPVCAYGNTLPSSSSSARPKRTQCKNACTNCQKACKKCDDSRPCQRCIRFGCLDTCVDSKRKERKKGVKRGPYKKCDGKSLSAGDAENNSGTQAIHGVHLPIGYLPGVWGAYSPTGPCRKLEGANFLQPVFGFIPIGDQPPHGGEYGSVSGGSKILHFPIGFFPTTFISYPGPFQPYPVSQGHGPATHFAYPPPGMSTADHLPHVGTAATNPSSSVDAHTNNSIVVEGSGKGKEGSCSQVNGQIRFIELQANMPVEKEKETN